MSVSKCKFNGSGKCGSSRGIEEVYSVLNVDRDCKNHLKSLKLLHQYEESPVNEKESIESRGGCSLLDEDFVCFYHRNYLGVFWKNSLKCSHPNHINREKINTRPATLLLIEKISLVFSEKKIPIGSKLCMVHLKKVNENSSNIEEANTSIVSEFNLSNQFEMKPCHLRILKNRVKFKMSLKMH